MELRTDAEGEQRELAGIYVDRGLDPGLAKQVAMQLMAHGALEAHARDELVRDHPKPGSAPPSGSAGIGSQLCSRRERATLGD